MPGAAKEQASHKASKAEVSPAALHLHALSLNGTSKTEGERPLADDPLVGNANQTSHPESRSQRGSIPSREIAPGNIDSPIAKEVRQSCILAKELSQFGSSPSFPGKCACLFWEGVPRFRITAAWPISQAASSGCSWDFIVENEAYFAKDVI